MTKFEKFFASSKLLTTAFIIAFAGFIVSAVFSFIPMNGIGINIESSVFTIVTAVLILLLFVTFRKHETNLMHISTGALFITFILSSIVFVVTAIVTIGSSPLFIILPLVEEALYIILFINHLTINTKHGPTRGRVVVNQVISVIICSYELFVIITYIVLAVQNPALTMLIVSYIVSALGKMFAFMMLVSIESKLNTYKVLREVFDKNGGWTEGMKQATKDDVFGR